MALDRDEDTFIVNRDKEKMTPRLFIKPEGTHLLNNADLQETRVGTREL